MSEIRLSEIQAWLGARGLRLNVHKPRASRVWLADVLPKGHSNGFLLRQGGTSPAKAICNALSSFDWSDWRIHGVCAECGERAISAGECKACGAQPS